MTNKKYPPLPNLNTLDIKALRIFIAVTQNKGFSAAQLELNLNQPTISNYMSQLESRLKVKLCSRGRSGFELTPQGEIVYEAAIQLFSSLEQFSSNVASCRGKLVGDMRIGIVDSLVSNQDFLFPEIIRRFYKQAPEVNLVIHKRDPQALMKNLIEDDIQFAITPLYGKPPESIQHFGLFEEWQIMYCGSKHPLFHIDESTLTLDSLKQANYASHDYVKNWSPPFSQYLKTKTLASDVETIAMLILSGEYIGYLPQHYGEIWQKKKLMKPLFVDEISYPCQLHLAFKKSCKSEASKLFISLFNNAYLSS